MTLVRPICPATARGYPHPAVWPGIENRLLSLSVTEGAILFAMQASVLRPTVSGLYEQDFFEWTVRNAQLLRAGRFEEADLEHIAEEIEDMGKSERRELETRLRVLLSHLLKWRFQPNHRGRSWQATIRVQRTELLRLLADMPSLQPQLRERLPEVYPTAVEGAIAETKLPDGVFPPRCPFSLDQILDADFFPD